MNNSVMQKISSTGSKKIISRKPTLTPKNISHHRYLSKLASNNDLQKQSCREISVECLDSTSNSVAALALQESSLDKDVRYAKMPSISYLISPKCTSRNYRKDLNIEISQWEDKSKQKERNPKVELKNIQESRHTQKNKNPVRLALENQALKMQINNLNEQIYQKNLRISGLELELNSVNQMLRNQTQTNNNNVKILEQNLTILNQKFAEFKDNHQKVCKEMETNLLILNNKNLILTELYEQANNRIYQLNRVVSYMRNKIQTREQVAYNMNQHKCERLKLEQRITVLTKSNRNLKARINYLVNKTQLFQLSPEKDFR